MPGQYVTVSTVAPGPERAGPCRACGGHEVSFHVFALDKTGVLRIGEITLCGGTCGDRWQCGFCPWIGDAGGRSAHQHMIAEHAA